MQSQNSKPLVSILCVTFNHEKYLKEALDSFLVQETDFSFELIIHDDVSTDGTREIINNYQKRFPDIVKPFFEQENQYSQGNDGFIREMFLKAEGKYIAQCEGDDFWTDPSKLQRQVDFLEAHPNHSLVFHPVRVFFEDKSEEDTIYPDFTHGFTVDMLLRQNFIQSNSVMYRARDSYNDLALSIMPYDWYLHLYHTGTGRIGFINRTMSAYRRHRAGIWWGTTSGENIDDVWKKYGINHLVLYSELLSMFGDTEKYRNIIDEHIQGTVSILNRIDTANNTTLNQTYIETYPNSSLITLSLIRSIEKDQETHKNILTKLTRQYDQTVRQNSNLEKQNALLQSYNNTITNSLSWKVTKPLRTMKRFLRKNNTNRDSNPR